MRIIVKRFNWLLFECQIVTSVYWSPALKLFLLQWSLLHFQFLILYSVLLQNIIFQFLILYCRRQFSHYVHIGKNRWNVDTILRLYMKF
jgi:hypothetical protein